MSGGSWDYSYHRVEELASRFSMERAPLRRAFGAHLYKVAKALKDVEWVDSADFCPGDEEAAIRAVLPQAEKAVLDVVLEDLKRTIDEATALLDSIEKKG